MRVLYIEMALGFGGSGKSLTELIAALPEVEPVVLSEFDLSAYAPTLPAGAVTVVPIPRTAALARFGRLEGYAHTAQRVSTWARAIIHAVRERRVDLIHANNGVAQNLPALIASRVTGVPVVVHQRGWEDVRRTLTLARAAVTGSHIIAISEAIRAQLIEFGFDASHIERVYDVILPPIGTPTPREQTGRPIRIGMHSVLTPWKGHRTFIDAAAVLHRAEPARYAFDIAGRDLDPTGAFESELRRRVHDSGLTDIVRFTGHVDDAYSWLANLDISVHASVTNEPLGRVIAEAQLARRAVVASRGGGASELVEHGRTGLLVDPGDATALAGAIRTLSADDALRARIADAGWQDARARFEVRALADEVRNVYRKATGHVA